MRRFYLNLQVAILVIVSISVIFYFNFTAEDAYITYRYAENWINTGSLVYNAGEPINAMTSPLHAILSAALFLVTDQTVLGNKILALVLLFISALIVWYRFKNQPQWQALAMILVLTPPSIILWTLGGLETPILLLLVIMAVYLAGRTTPFNLPSLGIIFLLASLAFLTRYDSILFFFPLTLYVALKTCSARHVAIALVAAAILPVAWFAVSILYFGDPLPTSFYVKTPIGNLGSLLYNGRYIAAYLLYVGIIPGLIFAFLLLRFKNITFTFLYGHFKSMAWLYFGLLLELLYGFTMATHHMMFSFRFFVPYLPAMAILVVDILYRASESSKFDLLSGRPASLFAGFLVCLMLFQVYQGVYTYYRSVNGISSIGEYRSLGIRDYVKFMGILRQEAFDIENHWDELNGSMDRSPRVLTYAGGMLPYTFREAYIYEQLVSYRHCFQRRDQGLFADYLHILAPRHGQIGEQLPGDDDNYSLVSSYEMIFDGSAQEFLVYYNPKPEDNNISQRIYEPCQQVEQVLGP